MNLYNDFSGLKEFYFKDQILRAALSISNNIVEGYDRKSDKENVRFYKFLRARLAKFIPC